MQEEAESFINHLIKLKKLNSKNVFYKRINISLHHFSFPNCFTFFEDVLNSRNDKTIDIFISISGIGKTNAAIAATQMIEKYKIKFLINIGTAGTINKNHKINDLFLIEKFIYFDVDTTKFNYSYGQIPKMPQWYAIDKNLNENLKSFLNQKKFKVSNCNLASGDKFLDSSKKQILQKIKNLNCDVVDMEATSYAHVAYVFKCRFISFKVISDHIFLKNNDLEHSKNMKLCDKKISELASIIFMK